MTFRYSRLARITAVTLLLVSHLLSSSLYAHAASPTPEFLGEFSEIGPSIELNGILYFSAVTAASGRELWRTDGTAAGTVMVKEINPDGDASPVNRIIIDDTIYFSADDDTAGRELWKSDGTAEGTVMVKDIAPGDIGSYPSDMTLFNGMLYFVAETPTHGRELWKSDGTAEGTVMVKDIRAGEEGSIPAVAMASLTVAGNTLFFSADDYDQPSQSNRELWKSDGTAEGTVMVKDLLIEDEDALNPWSSSPSDFTALGDIVIFRAYTAERHIFGTPWAMFKSDGTAEGTVKIRDMFGGAEGASDKWNPTFLGDKLYLAALVTDLGDELWVTDGTEEGTMLVKDINPNNSNFFPPSINELVRVNDAIFFATTDGTRGTELWKSDGTSEGTVLVKDIRLGNASSFPRDFVAAGNLLYFTADDGDGLALWQSDGEETMQVESVSADSFASVEPLFAGPSGAGYPLYFYAVTEESAGLWKLGGENVAPPIAVDDVAATTGSTPVSGNVLTNDSDPQGSPLTVSGTEQPANGTVTVDAAGHFTYTAVSGFSGADVFTYTVSNSHNLSDTARVVVVVQPATTTDAEPTVVTTTPGVTTTQAITDQGFSLSLQVPANAYSGTLEPGDNFFLVYTPIVTPTGDLEDAPANFEFAGMSFSLDSYLNETAFDSYTFGEPLVLEIVYPASAVEGLDPDELTLLNWDTESESWSSEGIEIRAHDKANRTITFAIAHLTEFGLFSPTDPGSSDDERDLFVPSIHGEAGEE